MSACPFSKKRFSLAISVLFCTLTFLPAANAFDNMIIFGDSLSDTGNNTWADMTNNGTGDTVKGGIGAPYTDFNPKTDHRDTWENYLAMDHFGDIPEKIYSAWEADMNPYKDNVCYAYGGADSSQNYLGIPFLRVTPSAAVLVERNTDCKHPDLNTVEAADPSDKNKMNTLTIACFPGLLKQVDNYLHDVNNKPNPNTLFFIWSGANDILYKFKPYIEQAIMTKTAQDAAYNIVKAKDKLVDHGVPIKNIYIFNCPDISLTPFALQHLNMLRDKDLPSGSYPIIDGLEIPFIGQEGVPHPIVKNQLAHVVDVFNDLLEKYLTGQETLPDNKENKHRLPASHIIDVHGLLENMVKNREQYSLKNIDESCIDVHAYPYCSYYLFAQEKHPSTTTHKWIARKITEISKNNSGAEVLN